MRIDTGNAAGVLGRAWEWCIMCNKRETCATGSSDNVPRVNVVAIPRTRSDEKRRNGGGRDERSAAKSRRRAIAH